MRRVLLRYRYWPLPILVWTVVVLASWSWNQALVEHKIVQLAADRAEFVFKMVETARLWNARHGGVYAAINEHTPPNPYLQVPDREITTPGGVRLTMVNPAYMTRQLIGVVAERTDLGLHLTSLKPLNPNKIKAVTSAQVIKCIKPMRRNCSDSCARNGGAEKETLRPPRISPS